MRAMSSCRPPEHTCAPIPQGCFHWKRKKCCRKFLKSAAKSHQPGDGAVQSDHLQQTSELVCHFLEAEAARHDFGATARAHEISDQLVSGFLFRLPISNQRRKLFDGCPIARTIAQLPSLNVIVVKTICHVAVPLSQDCSADKRLSSFSCRVCLGV